MEFPLRIPAIIVKQPLGDFFIVSFTAKQLLSFTYSNPLRIDTTDDDSYYLTGAQRPKSKNRLKEIRQYINSKDAAFPNAIILACNYDMNGALISDEDKRWRVEYIESRGYEIVIPTDAKIASIIDGQHRISGFSNSTIDKNEFHLLCSIYFDLPIEIQAYLFATINFNQKSVPKSLAYELFGVNLQKEPPSKWSPEKTAIFLTRKLNMNQDSPFHLHIFISAQQDELLKEKIKDSWAVSTATVVDGILKLYSKNPKLDKDTMHSKHYDERERSLLQEDGTPLRNMYLQINDKFIYVTVENYFIAVDEVLFRYKGNSYITKTIGIQALFAFLYEILKRKLEEDRNISTDYFKRFLKPAKDIDFGESIFPPAGVGKNRIVNLLKLLNGFILIDDLKEDNFTEWYKSKF